MTAESVELARLEDRLRAGEIPTGALPLLLEAVRHYRSCRNRRGARASSERRGGRRATRSRQQRGHGRLTAEDYPGAERILCTHPDLVVGSACPTPNCSGRLYYFATNADVELRAAAPVQGTVYERTVLRCSCCQTTFTAPLPKDAQGEKYDSSLDAVVAYLRYGLGMPHHRLEQWQAQVGIPLPASTQFERAETLADAALPAHREMERLAANEPLLGSDDTGARILSVQAEIRAEAQPERTGVFTTGIVAGGLSEGCPRIALYQSGRRHAGENVDRLLEHRASDAPELIHMADAANREPRYARRLAARCWAHARRKFVEAQEAFFEPCDFVLTLIAAVFHFDDEARHLDPAARLLYHQRHSAPVLDLLRAWAAEQLSQNIVEPNSQLGKALGYLENHWAGLTLFLRKPGVPLHNNLVEREIKPVIRHRRNSLFFRTAAGAAVGDVLLSLIRTCVLNAVDPVHYLTAVGRHRERVRAAPRAWMPWTYKDTLASIN